MYNYIASFLVGGTICVIAQILMDKTSLTPARILVSFVTIGVILGGMGIYEKVVEVGKYGATLPLPGFGNTLAKGVMEEVDKVGLIGAFTGGLKGSAGGISAAIVFGYIMALIFNSKTKN
ncbi:stage V sporulation protein AE [Oceanirhabdus sp. W0125-5]|uniref:stage V sporulation protein AE n=1 Tax=Oceanirhabdus sp. W0125-5 TaxID=2999116 RepID=UPI0022F33CB3|nr:stage V sporulation protein AE [Oceanirhabdus sp. W0125-5]WBW99468.1 stage V sporulation protein AE [Oceanirhabdus sp. W0125-5]